VGSGETVAKFLSGDLIVESSSGFANTRRLLLTVVWGERPESLSVDFPQPWLRGARWAMITTAGAA